MKPRIIPPCNQVPESRRPYRTYLECSCGWHRMVFHRNAMARVSLTNKARNDHLKSTGEN
jgi:hypothetical protein